MEKEMYMPIRAHPYNHQRRAFEFALRTLGVLRKEGDEDADGNNDLRFMWEGIPKAEDRNP
ncbi:MAG: hypothetical protein LUE31_08530 [Lachnospiraceae bacterium]|nr:hypothetical protein [Lachnospiraceae bacterium]